MTFLSQTSIGIQFLARFTDSERETAAELIDEILLVSRDDFANGLRELLDEFSSRCGDPTRKMALYAERPVKKVFGTIPAFFPNSRYGRATGPGAPPIIANPRDQEVGSEGVIAQFVTDYCRRNRAIAINHPGPSKMRRDRVKEIIIMRILSAQGTG
jgi:hypothetical protein